MQLPLDLISAHGHGLEHFHPGPNAEALTLVRRVLSGRRRQTLYLWGCKGVGKTHLLQGLCRAAAAAGAACAYLPMRLAGDQFGPRGLEGLESLPIVCIDDLDAVIGDAVWEQSLTRFLAQAELSGTASLIAADADIPGLECVETGLVLQLSMSTRRQLLPLDMEAKVRALQLHASARGIRLPERVARYLLRHYAVDLGILTRALAALDYASMASQRKLTIPFVRSVLEINRESGGRPRS